jgi:hypothetical protein
MTREEYVALVERSLKNLQPYEPPPIEQDRDEPDDRFEFRPLSFRRRADSSRNEPEPEPVQRSSDAMIARRIEAHAAQYAQDKAGIKKCLEALADEAGKECGKLAKQIKELQKQVSELTTQLNDTRGELALIRALQPKRLMRKPGGTQTIEGSLGAPQNFN